MEMIEHKGYRNLLWIQVLIGFLIFPNYVSANLVEYGLLHQEDGLLTLDTQTGLEWLDLTATRNISYSDVIGGYGGYVTTFDFRVATESDINGLFQNVGVPDEFSDDEANIPGATQLFLFLGVLHEEADPDEFPLSRYSSHGMREPDQPCCPDSPGVSTFYLTYEYQEAVSGRAYLHNGYTNLETSFDYQGTFLVRNVASPFPPSVSQPEVLPPPSVAHSPIPIPAAAWLLSSGFIGLIGLAMRKRLLLFTY